MSATDDYMVTRDKRDVEAEKDRRKAEKLWKRVQASEDLGFWKDRILDEAGRQGWAFCERICDESAELAESDPEIAEELAAFAVTMAPNVPGDKPLVSGIQEYAWVHLGNACRARGDLARAGEAFREGNEFFLGGMMGVWPNPLRRQRLERLLALMLRDQGKLREAMEKIDFALQLARDDSMDLRAVLLLEKGRMLRRLGRPGEAAEALSRADKLAAEVAGPRVALRIAIELGAALCDAGRHGEVKKLPAGLRKAAEELALEHARLRCLDGRVAAGLGRLKEAQAVLDLGPAEFPGGALADFGLLSLEVAVLHAQKGRAAELKSLAESMPRLIEGPGLSREAAAVLKLFCRLALHGKLAVASAPQFAQDFARLSAGR